MFKNPRGVLLLLAAVMLLPGCAYFNNRPPTKPAEKIASLPPQAPTNDVPAPKAEAVTVTKPEPVMVPPPELNLEAERNALMETDLAFSRMSEEKGAAQAFYEFVVPEAITLS